LDGASVGTSGGPRVIRRDGFGVVGLEVCGTVGPGVGLFVGLTDGDLVHTRESLMA
jgi:hypothetical protein